MKKCQSQKVTYCMILFIQHSWNDKRWNGEQISCCQVLWGDKGWEVVMAIKSQHKGSCDNWYILYFNCGGNYMELHKW
jgi:hypothetical protein